MPHCHRQQPVEQRQLQRRRDRREEIRLAGHDAAEVRADGQRDDDVRRRMVRERSSAHDADAVDAEREQQHRTHVQLIGVRPVVGTDEHPERSIP